MQSHAPLLPAVRPGAIGRAALALTATAFAVAFAVALAVTPAVARAQDPVAPDPVAQQIDIGSQWFRARCMDCHDKGDLSNANFQLKWSGQTAYDLVDLVARTMPDDEPGALTRGTYVAIVTYLMNLNGMPPTAAVLSSDSTDLRGVRLSFVRAAAQSPPR